MFNKRPCVVLWNRDDYLLEAGKSVKRFKPHPRCFQQVVRGK